MALQIANARLWEDEEKTERENDEQSVEDKKAQAFLREAEKLFSGENGGRR